MYQPTEDERRTLALEALEALWGADVARRRLLAGLSMGTPSIEHTTYLIKTRVKDHNSIVEKVIDRRQKNPAYRVGDITDIIGIRILTLYRSDLPEMLQRFLRLVDGGCREPFKLFAGESAKEAVSELIIYGYPPKGQLCEQLVSQLKPFNLALDGKRIKTESKDSDYSSIHLLIRARAPIGEARLSIPVEVQIRTVLEDAWGEVEHALMYKLKNTDAERRKELLEIARNQLRTWKGALDNCGDQADTIRQLMKYWAGNVDPGTAFKSIDDEELKKLGLPPLIQKKVDESVVRIQRFFKQLDDPDVNQSREQSVDDFVEIAIVLQDCLNSVTPETEGGRPYKFLMMEVALCLLWMGRLLRKPPSAGEKPVDQAGIRRQLLAGGVLTAQPEKADDYPFAMSILEEAELRYFTLERRPDLARDPIIAYRLGEVMASKDERESATAKFEEANNLLSESSLRADHPMHVQIPRRLGFAYWERADALKEKARKSNKDFALAQRRGLYERAIAVTQKALEATPRVDWKKADDYAPFEQSLTTINNLLDYCIEYLKSGMPIEALGKFNLDARKIRELFNELAPGGELSRITDPNIADTIRAAARFFGLRDIEKAAAKRVLDLCDSKDWTARIKPEIIAALRRDAQSSLETPADEDEGPISH
jgi:ppGpp synthetase/RelA/SpoT-type nucleotidyltranferase